MRINVYEEELTGEVEFIQKNNVIGEDGNPVTFVGIRFILKGGDHFHHNEHDDDRPAITFWVRPQAAGLNTLSTMWAEAHKHTDSA